MIVKINQNQTIKMMIYLKEITKKNNHNVALKYLEFSCLNKKNHNKTE